MSNTGAMIALIPSESDLTRLTLPFGESRDDLHLTLWYLGDAVDWSTAQRDAVVACVTSAARDLTTVAANAFGVDHWNPIGPSPSWVLSVGDDTSKNTDRLTTARDAFSPHRISDPDSETGALRVDEDHTPWVAHVCLAYGDVNAVSMQDMVDRLGPLTFDRVRVAFADITTDVQLGRSGSTVSAMPWHKVHNHSECPADKPWAVVKDSDSSTAGCHATESDADDQLAALYASEDDASAGTDDYRATEEHMTDDTATLAADPSIVEDASVTQLTVVDEVEPDESTVRPWTGPLCVEGVTTGDGREFAVDALTWADPPLPLRWNKEDSHGGIAQTVAVNVGRIDQVWRDGNQIMGSGVINMAEEDGRRVYALLKGQFLKGVSIDADDIGDADIEYVWPENGDEANGDSEDDILSILFAMPEKVVYHGGRIRAATLCDIPAFVEAYIALDEDAEQSLAASAAPSSTFNLSSVTERPGLEEHRVDVTGPPRAWFEDPQLSVIVPLTVTSEGRIYGHAAQWGQCHIGIQNECVTPPREDSHPYFMMGEITCADGSIARVGQITVDTAHAAPYLDAVHAVDHYANTGCVVADIAVGNDRHGIWMAGALRPNATPAQVHALRAAGQVSGDWRRIGGSLRLVGLLAVNVPGYPIQRPRARIADGQPQALVAAGRLTLADGTSEGRVPGLDEGALRLLKAAIVQRVVDLGAGK